MSFLRHIGRLSLCFVIIVIGMAAAVLSGCASIFDAPPAPLIEVRPVEYLRQNDATPVLCEYVRDGFRWTMMVPRNECVGWTPI